MQSPEKLARENIDSLRTKCGSIIQDYEQPNLSAGRGIAIRDVPLKKGRCDYLLLIDRKPVGIVEAKKAGFILSSVAGQPRSRRDREHLEADNVLGPIYKAFGEKLWLLMEELNLTLAA